MFVTGVKPPPDHSPDQIVEPWSNDRDGLSFGWLTNYTMLELSLELEKGEKVQQNKMKWKREHMGGRRRPNV